MKLLRKIICVLLIIVIGIIGAGCKNTDKTTAAQAPVKVILDCDMGYMNDDTLCLSMLIQAEKRGLVEILGITLDGGNNFIDASYSNYGEIQYGSATNTEELLSKLDRQDIPYYRGTDLPIGVNLDSIDELEDYFSGLDYLDFDDNHGVIHFWGSVDSNQICDSDEATDFLIRSVSENPGEVVIFAVGPTMNIAKAVQKDEAFASNVKAIYYMGGALGDTCLLENNRSELVEGIAGANVTAYTEYNVMYDPVAFGICISAPFPEQYIVPGSCMVSIDQEIGDRFISESDGTGVSGLWARHFEKVIQGFPFWDPFTVYAFLCPEAITSSSTKYVTVDTDRSSSSFGRTDGYTTTEYERLSQEERAKCGKAEIIYEMSDFWDYTIDLLCN